IAAMIPVLFALALGERLRPLTWLGVGLALFAIALVSRPATTDSPTSERSTTARLPPGFLLALLAGVCVGIFFLSLARTSAEAGMWPLVAARIGSILLFGIIAVVTGQTLRMRARAGTTAATGGALDMVANSLYMSATRLGALSIVVTLASLYPASTVLLARWILHERLSFMQMMGIACALAAVVIIVSQGAAI
ncbi:MAG TPA: EamA family transporter, partial [Chthoniobacterales bacterium]